MMVGTEGRVARSNYPETRLLYRDLNFPLSCVLVQRLAKGGPISMVKDARLRCDA